MLVTDYEAMRRGEELWELRWHWGGAYTIEWMYHRFRAYRRDTGLPLVAESADELHHLIITDYSAKPVPREFHLDA